MTDAESETWEDATLLTLKKEERARSQGTQQPQKLEKARKGILPRASSGRAALPTP